MSLKYHIDEKKYRIKPQERYIRINGWAFDTSGRDVQYRILLNGQAVEGKIKEISRKDVADKYEKYISSPKVGFQIKVYIEDVQAIDRFSIILISGRHEKRIVDMGQKDILRMTDTSTISYKIDNIFIADKRVTISGWATSVYGNNVLKVCVEDSAGERIDSRCFKENRSDLVEEGYVSEENRSCGFKLEFTQKENGKYRLVISDGHKVKYLSFDTEEVIKKQRIRVKALFLKKAAKHLNSAVIREVYGYVKKNGIFDLREYLVTRVNVPGKPYMEWFKEHMPTEEELQKQREANFEYCPKFSIVVPVYRTPIEYLKEMVDSVRNQSYGNWELCIADGSEGDKQVQVELEKYCRMDSRIKYRILEKNRGISGNTNAALELATGEYVGLFDHDDILAPNALYEVASALQEDNYDILYTDEDKISGKKKIHMDPNFKPDFSIDLFRSHNYITHFFVVRKQILDKIGGFKQEYDGAQDYDLMFRCIENAKKIHHIPMILYHWRVHMNSVAGDPSSKMYAYEAGRKAIEDHLKRSGVEAVVEHAGLWGMYHVKYAIHGQPLVSIVIPNKDHTEDLDRCVRSIMEKSTYKNFEIVIVENNSEDAETFAYYEKLEEEYDKMRVIRWEGKFNYSAINNYGVQFVKGEYLLFLNNDTELIAPESIQEMLGCCMREEVGAVGAKLLYDDNTVQHAGVVIGFGDYAGHVNTEIGRDAPGYMMRARINCNYSAVTAACMMTKKTLFDQVGGFDEQFVVACNDVDYCLKLRELDKLIVFNAFSEWFHYESKSRGYEDTEEKVKRFEDEKRKFRVKWDKVLKEGDPFYNINFPFTQAPFTLG